MRLAVWLGALTLYGAFVYWYTNFSGPLTEAEIQVYSQRMEAIEVAEPAQQALLKFMREDDGGQFVMVNLLQLTPWDGPAADAPMDKYMAYMWPRLLFRASMPLFSSTTSGPPMDRVGLDADDSSAAAWTSFALMRYRSRRDLVDIALGEGFRDSHEYKIAALTRTLAFPVSPDFNLAEPRLLLGLLLFSLCSLYSLLSRRREAVEG